MVNSEDYSDLQREWREIVLNKLEVLEEGQREIQKDMVEIKLNFVKHSEYIKTVENLEKRLYELEQTKAKAWGVVIGLNIVLYVGSLILSKIWPSI